MGVGGKLVGVDVGEKVGVGDIVVEGNALTGVTDPSVPASGSAGGWLRDRLINAQIPTAPTASSMINNIQKWVVFCKGSLDGFSAVISSGIGVPLAAVKTGQVVFAASRQYFR